jgi:signal transduction histidine kinase
LSTLIIITTFIIERHFFGGIEELLNWIRTARENNFSDIAPVPTRSSDEIGLLGLEMSEAVKHFKGLEKREKQISQEKSEFISVLAHQLWTPITGLRWGLEGLSGESTSPKEQVELRAQTEAYMNRTINLVKHLLEVSQIDEGKFEYEFKQVDILPILQKILAECRPEAERHSLILALKTPSTLPSAYIDPDRITFAIKNLVENAINYTLPGGSVTVFAELRERSINIRVQDTGIGISADDQKKLFSRYSRGAGATRMRPDGFGLGLYITRNIIVKHGSDIKITSAPGSGSTFAFTIPTEKPDILNPQVSLETFFTGT